MEKEKLLNYLNDYLQVNEFKDASYNGLQVDISWEEINKIWYAVDANTYIFDKAIKEDIDLLITHHGILWWFEFPITGVFHERLQKLLNNNIWLYGCHLPLDAHTEVWNNIWLIKWLANIMWVNNYSVEKFWIEDRNYIGLGMKMEQPIHMAALVSPFAEQMWIKWVLHNFWEKDLVYNIAMVSWWAAKMAEQAKNENYDVLITWEWVHYQITYAKELWQSIMLWWHRETEKIWVKLLAHHLENQFWVETVFLDQKY